MNSKKITVKEFDIINEKLLKDNNSNYSDEFKELTTFIDEFVSSPDNADAYELMTKKTNRQNGLYVQIKNYVGLIQLKSGFQIEILPKIDMATKDEDNKRIFIKMLRTMKDFDGKVFNMSNLSIDKMNLYEIFINLYLQETDRLLKKGLKSSYISKEENLCTLKGKLVIKEHLKANVAHKERFYVKYDEYQLNRSENKLLKSTLLKLLSISESMNNKKFCRQLLDHFENIDASINYDYDFSKVVIDRNTKDYEMLMKWSKVILKNKSFSTFAGDSKSRALLFPMHKLFESYVGKYMKRVFENTSINVSTQDTGHYLFDNPEPQFAVKPDIVLTRPDNTVVIMDTKWKDLIPDENKNYGISQNDMYQMYAYSKKYGNNQYNPEVFLLYPLNQSLKGHAPIDYSDSFGVNVHVRFIDLSNDIMLELDKIRQEI